MIYKFKSNEIIDKEINLYYAFLTIKNDITENHCHDFYEFFFIVSGNVNHIINGNKRLVYENSITLIKPSDNHYFEKIDGAECKFVNIAITPDTFNSVIELLGYEINIMNIFINPTSLLLSDYQKMFILSELDIINTSNEKSIIKAKLLSIFIHVLSLFLSSALTKESNCMPIWLREITIKMRKKENIQKGINNLYSISGKSKEHVCREFIKFFGVSPTKWLNELKINYAKNLLTNTNMDVLNIALECGYENIGYFHRLFKQKFDTSPLKYRKLHSHIIMQE